ncbi:hypothetical protein DIPPA_20186 [Diplonema papillatum]|nr:hypothetical protein DIPPA_20186 [Diplonema papillatum]
MHKPTPCKLRSNAFVSEVANRSLLVQRGLSQRPQSQGQVSSAAAAAGVEGADPIAALRRCLATLQERASHYGPLCGVVMREYDLFVRDRVLCARSAKRTPFNAPSAAAAAGAEAQSNRDASQWPSSRLQTEGECAVVAEPSPARARASLLSYSCDKTSPQLASPGVLSAAGASEGRSPQSAAGWKGSPAFDSTGGRRAEVYSGSDSEGCTPPRQGEDEVGNLLARLRGEEARVCELEAKVERLSAALAERTETIKSLEATVEGYSDRLLQDAAAANADASREAHDSSQIKLMTKRISELEEQVIQSQHAVSELLEHKTLFEDRLDFVQDMLKAKVNEVYNLQQAALHASSAGGKRASAQPPPESTGQHFVRRKSYATQEPVELTIPAAPDNADTPEKSVSKKEKSDVKAKKKKKKK